MSTLFISLERSFDAPRVARGNKIVKVLVGPDETEFTVHKNLLCAASKFFERALNGSFAEADAQEVRLPEEQPEVFDLFIDWLYAGRFQNDCHSLSALKQRWSEDTYWLMIYRMADRLFIPGLQLQAYHTLTSLFTGESSFGGSNAYMPSRDFLFSLFNEEAPLALQMHVVEHVAFWLPKSTDENEWARNFTAHDRYGTEIALAMVRSHSKNPFLHPSLQMEFAKNHGFDMSELKKEARAADEKAAPVPAGNRMACAILKDEKSGVGGPPLGTTSRQPSAFSFGRPVTQTTMTTTQPSTASAPTSDSRSGGLGRPVFGGFGAQL